jgi:type VI secretion system VgrG family protein
MPHMANLIYEGDMGGWRPEERVQDWVKMQQMRSGKVTLWDNCFELPYKHLECTELIQETVQVGKVTHKLKVGGNDQLEVYDYPGGYAQRFDGISKSGGEQAGDLQKIFTDNQRTTKIRMEQEAMSSLLTFASSNYANLVPGYKFNLQRHYQDDAAYIVTEIHHSISQGGNYRSSAKEAEGDFKCSNQFTCIPAAVKFRPPLLTPRPALPGTQTAVVVGPAGEEIFTDKYGRVKVQFPWDRQGKGDADSSCWVRVAVPWAGKTFGFVSIPRIGQEVVVAFEEGDLDRPIVIGCVYNADNMPPHKLPDDKTQSGIKSRSSTGAGSDNLNEIRFEDKKGSEHIFIHGEKDMEVRVKKDTKHWYGQDTHCTVVRDNFVDVQRDYSATIGKDMKVEIKTDHHLKVGGKETMDVGGGQSLNVTGNMNYKCSGNLCIEVGGTVSIKGANVILEASTAACISGGSGFSVYNAGGVQISGPLVSINSGGSKMPGTPATCVPVTAPNKPVEPIKPGTTAKSAPVYSPISPGAAAAAPRSSPPAPSQAPTHNPNAAENKENKYWIEIVLCDEAGQPCPGEYYEVKLPDGETVATGTLDDKGFARVDHIKDAGNCQITFPKLDKDAWEPK